MTEAQILEYQNDILPVRGLRCKPSILPHDCERGIFFRRDLERQLNEIFLQWSLSRFPKMTAYVPVLPDLAVST